MKSSDLKVCLFPMEIKWDDKEANLSLLRPARDFLHRVSRRERQGGSACVS